MIKHYITKYKEDGKRYAESWIQLNIFGLTRCYSKKRIELQEVNTMALEIKEYDGYKPKKNTGKSTAKKDKPKK